LEWKMELERVPIWIVTDPEGNRYRVVIEEKEGKVTLVDINGIKLERRYLSTIQIFFFICLDFSHSFKTAL